jgi:hypothetical protein
VGPTYLKVPEVDAEFLAHRKQVSSLIGNAFETETSVKTNILVIDLIILEIQISEENAMFHILQAILSCTCSLRCLDTVRLQGFFKWASQLWLELL